VDINDERIDGWNSKELPVYEPGLDKIIKKLAGKNLFFSKDIEKQIKENDIIFVSGQYAYENIRYRRKAWPQIYNIGKKQQGNSGKFAVIENSY